MTGIRTRRRRTRAHTAPCAPPPGDRASSGSREAGRRQGPRPGPHRARPPGGRGRGLRRELRTPAPPGLVPGRRGDRGREVRSMHRVVRVRSGAVPHVIREVAGRTPYRGRRPRGPARTALRHGASRGRRQSSASSSAFFGGELVVGQQARVVQLAQVPDAFGDVGGVGAAAVLRCARQARGSSPAPARGRPRVPPPGRRRRTAATRGPGRIRCRRPPTPGPGRPRRPSGPPRAAAAADGR